MMLSRAVRRVLNKSPSTSSCIRLNLRFGSTKRWIDKQAVVARATVTLPTQAKEELLEWINSQDTSQNNPDSITAQTETLPACQSFCQEMEEKHLVQGAGFALLQPIEELASNPIQMRYAAFALAGCLGEQLVQNAQGVKSILVFDRDAGRRMVDGQRYHQSHEGGSLHTDNVNVPESWEYMLLTCLKPAAQGGDSIFVSAFDVYDHLCEFHPDVVETLQQDFLWELRGFDDRFYKAPILFKNKLGEPCYRWLREYLESAHSRANQPLSHQQQHALDTLTRVTEMEDLQIRLPMAQGEILFANDMQLFHGRTTFYDEEKAQDIYDFGTAKNRLFQRNWVSTHSVYKGMNQSRFEYV